MPKRREKEKVAIAMAKKFPRTTNSTSSEQAIDSVPSESIPTASYQTSKVEVKIEIVESSSGDNINYIRDQLYLAALKGDWPSAKKLHKENPDPKIWERPISQEEMNALQIAVAAKQTAFATELLKCMDATQLEIQNATGDTALAITARSGSVKIATKLVEKNEKLPMIRNKQKHPPLLIAAIHRQRDMVLYLYGVTSFEQLTRDECIKLLLHVIPCDLFEIADEILINDPTLATAEDENGRIALEEFARKPFAIGSRNQMSAWERCIGYCLKRVYNKALMQTLANQLVVDLWSKARRLPWEQRKKYSSTIFLAAELGNVEFLTILIRSDPDLIWMVDENDRNIFHISILHRQKSIFNLIYEIGIFKDMIASHCDKNKNNMLHLAGELSQLHTVPGAALQMQHELLWYKEIEKIVPLEFLKAKNLDKKTPKDIFSSAHKDLHNDGEKWMRDTAMHCMLVATLIAAVVFAAAFTVPGGNDQKYGTPIFEERNWFMVFFISDSIALLSSSTSILIFLSVLTSRFTEDDFLGSLPKRLMFGLITLFISIAGMVIAFAATCFLMCQGKMTRVPIYIIALASVPIFSFLLLHYELFSDIIRSTLLPRFLFRSRKRRFF